jgi:methyl-accepting chemotaxis protein
MANGDKDTQGCSELFQALPVPTVVVDADGKVTAWNAAMEAATGRSAQEMLGKRAWTAFYPKRKPLALDDAVDAGGPAEEEICFTHAKSGAPASLTLKAKPYGTGALGVLIEEGAKAEMEALRHDLRERSKEITCVYALGSILERDQCTRAELARAVSEILPPAWLYPEVCCARVTLGEVVAVSSGFREGRWRQASNIACGGRTVGTVEVFYTEERPPRDEGPFLADERKLIDAIALRIAGAVVRLEQADELNRFVAEMKHMSDEHNAGDIDVVIRTEKFGGALADMARGVNEMVAGHIAVKKKAMACIAEFGKGNFEAPLEEFPGKKRFINDTIEQMRRNLVGFITEMKHMSDEHNAGDIDVVMPVEKFAGSFSDMARGVNEMVAGHIAVKKKAMACIAEFGKGNFEAPLEQFPGKKRFINETIERVRSNLQALIADADGLVQAAVEGRLKTRADASKHQGDFRKIVQGVNDTLDAVIGPLNVAADYVDKISKGDIPSKITDSYNGDFNLIKNNLNTCIDAVNALVSDAGMLSAAAVDGKLATRADASKHRGDFRKIVQGVNDTLDAVIGPLNVAADYVDKISKGDIPSKITDSYNGDFNLIKNNLNTCIDAVNALVSDAGMLSAAAVDGKLATRADANKHRGDFRRIVQGVNETLDSVIGPLNVAAHYVDRISKGDIPPKITDNYNGDFNLIKNNLNTCIDAVNALVNDASMLSVAAVEGRLKTRADASKHQGDFRKIVQGVNETLSAVIDPVMDAASVLDRLANYDLTARVEADYQGDHAAIKNALNATGKALHDALAQVADSVEQVSSATQQIAASSQSVAQGASEQASSLEETSSSLEEMSGMTKQNADNTVQAKTLASATKEAAEKGGHAMGRMIDAMEKIRAAAEGTAQIIKDINEIAFQTNLLALNAAVEAARAGDAGRGFAVVAEEVRNLALRSKEAAKKTEDLIKMSVGHAESGRVISSEVAGSLTEIVRAAGKVNDIVSEIAVASQEQARGIDQVNRAVAEMDKVVQASAANAEESSSAAEELSSQAEELASLVGRFEMARTTRALPARAGKALPALPRAQASKPKASAKSTSNGAAKAAQPKPSFESFPMDEDPDFKEF